MEAKLIVTKFKEVQPEGVELSHNGTVRTKDGSERSSILLTQTAMTIVNGSMWGQTRVAALSLPVSVIGEYSPVEGENFNPKLKKSLGYNFCIQMVEEVESKLDNKSGWTAKRRGTEGELITTDEGEQIYQRYVIAPVGTMDITIERTRESIATPIPQEDARN